jgi:hypothetical protein
MGFWIDKMDYPVTHFNNSSPRWHLQMSPASQLFMVD